MKRLVFASLTAVVTVSGAYAQTIFTWYTLGSTTAEYYCIPGQGNCFLDAYPDSGNPYIYPDSAMPGPQGSPRHLVSIPHDL